MNWKDIPGFEGLYQVSDCGQVKSCSRSDTFKEKILKPILDAYGYHLVNLYKEGKQKTFKVHRLVALVFLEGNNSLTVNHIDECKTNNHVSNLEYLSSGDNTRAWIKNNPERRAEIVRESIKKANEASGCVSQQILDTQTGKTFPSIRAVSRYMHEEEGAKGSQVWIQKIRRGQQNRFKILNKLNEAI